MCPVWEYALITAEFTTTSDIYEFTATTAATVSGRLSGLQAKYPEHTRNALAGRTRRAFQTGSLNRDEIIDRRAFRENHQCDVIELTTN